LSLVIVNVHRHLAADLNYASFCNVNTAVNCDVVLSSSYAQLGGVSVAVLAALYHAGMLAMGLAIMRTASVSRRVTLATLVLAAACVGFLFSLYLAIVAIAVLNTICLLCSGLYVVAVGMLVAGWLLRSGVQRQQRKSAAARVQRERWVWAGSGIALAAIGAAAAWEASSGGRVLSAAQIQQERPDFYRHFFAQPIVEVPADARHARGASDAPITIVEFSDFGCGHCAAFDRRIGDLLRSDKRVRLVFRHFPLDALCNPAIHGTATGERCMAARAAECAGEQERFWQYARLLFEHQPDFSAAALRRYAEKLEIDLAKFDACVADDAARARVESDVKLAASLGVRSTPTLFINGRRFQGDPGENLMHALVLAQEER
jgi:protein-disulfide isomerase/uncharacterized membrane protein